MVPFSLIHIDVWENIEFRISFVSDGLYHFLIYSLIGNFVPIAT